jgi:hypothetical protein
MLLLCASNPQHGEWKAMEAGGYWQRHHFLPRNWACWDIYKSILSALELQDIALSDWGSSFGHLVINSPSFGHSNINCAEA